MHPSKEAGDSCAAFDTLLNHHLQPKLAFFAQRKTVGQPITPSTYHSQYVLLHCISNIDTYFTIPSKLHLLRIVLGFSIIQFIAAQNLFLSKPTLPNTNRSTLAPLRNPISMNASNRMVLGPQTSTPKSDTV